jgi:hypothetical protein
MLQSHVPFMINGCAAAASGYNFEKKQDHQQDNL